VKDFVFFVGNKRFVLSGSEKNMRAQFQSICESIVVKQEIKYIFYKGVNDKYGDFKGFVSGCCSRLVDVVLKLNRNSYGNYFVVKVHDDKALKSIINCALRKLEENVDVVKKSKEFKVFGKLIDRRESLKEVVSVR
jgi:hypothetical protein